MMPVVPPILVGSVTEKIAELQRREIDLGWQVRFPFEQYLLNWRQRLEQIFLQHFIISTRADRQKHWDPIVARQIRLDDLVTRPLLAGLEDLEDDLVAFVEDQQREAFWLGAMYGRWQLALGGLDDYDSPLPEFFLATFAGLTVLDRLRQWGVVYRAKLAHLLKGMVVANQTLLDSVGQFDTLVTQYGSRMTALVQNEYYHEAQVGEAAAVAPYRHRELWLTKDDERVCPICAPLHLTYTQLVPIRDTHPKCLVGETVVGHATARAAMKRLYKGTFITVCIASGEHLTVTENHPILTRRGWKGAGAVKEGDEIVCCTSSERVVTLVRDCNVNMKPTISEIQEAFSSPLGVTPVEVVQTAEDFHGDGTCGHVAQIWADCGRRVGGYTSLVKEADQGLFKRRPNAAFQCLCALAQLIHRLRPAFTCGMSSLDLSLALLAGHPAPLQPFLFSSAAQDTSLREVVSEGVSGESSTLRELKDRYPGQVAFSHVIHVDREFSERHVYNLETDQGYYTGNTFVVANCRCAKVPVMVPLTPTPLSFGAFADRYASQSSVAPL